MNGLKDAAADQAGGGPGAERARTEIGATTIRFAGDSGDGVQLLGSRFASTTAIFGDDVITLADYPAEIRPPAGTVAGVSGFQLRLGSEDVYTAGDDCDVLVAMNPAALKANLATVRKGGIIIVNEDAFTQANFEKAGYAANPLEDGELSAYRVIRMPLTRLTETALKSVKIGREQVHRSRNFFAFGFVCWLFDRPTDATEKWIRSKFGKTPEVVEANLLAVDAGNKYGESLELFTAGYVVRKPKVAKTPGTYRYVSGNAAMALGLLTAAQRAGLRLFLGSYPITPASDILHELAGRKEFGVTTFQAEDEIAAVGAAIGASFAGALGVTTTSGPGMALKTEFINLAVMTELPLVIVNVQRGGPSTGLPTKMEQADLFQALWSRNGESPLPVLAARSPKDCYRTVIEAAAIAVKYMTPVVVLSDGYIANGSEPWRIPPPGELPWIPVRFHKDPSTYQPYERDPETLARPWAIPGTPGLEHRLGGLEKKDVTGGVDLGPDNHEKMVHLRAEKVARVAREYAPLKVHGPERSDLLVIGWGSSYGAIMQATSRLRDQGRSVASTHLRHLNPFPKELEEVLRRHRRVLVVENNLGQLWTKLRAEYLVAAERLNKVNGTPFRVDEIERGILRALGENG